MAIDDDSPAGRRAGSLPDFASNAARYTVHLHLSASGRRIRSRQAHPPTAHFRILSPVTLALLLAALATSWHVPASRPGLIAALAGLVVADVITFAFHYPRLAVMFRAPLPDDSGKLRRAAREWAVGNVVRAVLLVVAFLAVLQAFVALMVR
jgi:small-conductance mechanosensitive channel